MESSLVLLIPLSVALVFLIGWVFWSALRGGQFDDLERPAYEILEDDDRAPDPPAGAKSAAEPPKG